MHGGIEVEVLSDTMVYHGIVQHYGKSTPCNESGTGT